MQFYSKDIRKNDTIITPTFSFNKTTHHDHCLWSLHNSKGQPAGEKKKCIATCKVIQDSLGFSIPIWFLTWPDSRFVPDFVFKGLDSGFRIPKPRIKLRFYVQFYAGGAVASWLVCSTSERMVRIRNLAGDIVLCSWARHFTPSVPLSTQVYKWVPAKCWG